MVYVKGKTNKRSQGGKSYCDRVISCQMEIELTTQCIFYCAVFYPYLQQIGFEVLTNH